METIHYKYKKEYLESNDQNSECEKRRRNLIISLENSGSFVNTHTIIKELKEVEGWTQEELDLLMDIAVANSQVFYILKDSDVKEFYMDLLGKMKTISDNGRKVEEELKQEE